MLRRLPTAFFLIAGLLSSVAVATEEPARPSILSATLSGGFAWRQSSQAAVAPQTRATAIDGISPTLMRLRVDWFPLRWLGVEGEGLGDFFTAIQNTTNAPLPKGSARGMGRVGLALRFVTDGGFVLNGSLGYGLSAAPIVRYSAATLMTGPVPDVVLSNGPVARLGIGYHGARFEGLAGATAMLGLGSTPVLSIEPQLWLAGRVADVGPTALWVGVDASVLLEGSPATVGYGGRAVRMALGLKLELLPPAPPGQRIDGVEGGSTTLKLKVLGADGAAAVGALLSLDGAAPVPLDAQGELVSPSRPGAHTVKATLAGHRDATAQAQAVEGQETTLTLRLEPLTGPGKLSGVVRASATARPVPDATVTAGESPPVQTGPDGSYHFDGVGPGPVKVRVDAQGFTSADEVAQVPPESAATLDVQLEALGKGSPATVRGLVRSRTGEPLKASVVIKGLATKVQVTPEGRFLVTVPGGEYVFIISAPGYVTQSKKVVLADGDQAILHTELQKVTK